MIKIVEKGKKKDEMTREKKGKENPKEKNNLIFFNNNFLNNLLDKILIVNFLII